MGHESITICSFLIFALIIVFHDEHKIIIRKEGLSKIIANDCFGAFAYWGYYSASILIFILFLSVIVFTASYFVLTRHNMDIYYNFILYCNVFCAGVLFFSFSLSVALAIYSVRLEEKIKNL
jgi:hypothetical protein